MSLDGWNALSDSDLVRMMYGSPELTGYFNYRKAINLKKTLGLVYFNERSPMLDAYDIKASDFLEIFHQKRIDYYNDRKLILHSESGYSEISMQCRGMAGYQAKVGDRLEDLRDFLIAKNLPVVHLRLSMKTPEGYSPLDSLIDMKSIQNRLMSFIQVKLGFRPHYIWVNEPTKRGHCHFHFLFVGMNYLLPKEDLDWWWKRTGLGDESGVWIEDLREGKEGAERILGYLIKYLLKPHSDGRWCGLLALTRKREWGMSNTLRSKISRWKSENLDQSGLTCIGETNSNSILTYDVVGILDSWEISTFLHPQGGTKPPPLKVLLQDLREVRGISKRLSSGMNLWHMYHQEDPF